MTHVTCRLTAKNRDQLRNLTLGNRVRAIFTFLLSDRVYSYRSSAPTGKRSIVMSVSVCVRVCWSVRDHISDLHQNFVHDTYGRGSGPPLAA